ncbi:MAG: RNA-binding S4 domain-containing protein, partial [Deltaproteobacteria bacterium]|nr:RNA-binding S4 domain-containing protein [Deltaproteobacteria bacterium]MBW2536144.1 RNA-binding S4 domain-containing protein [Deltaproteobacteria bacterium]
MVEQSGADAGLPEVRIDKWLWAARLYKTRSLATRACASGHVKCNGSSVKASKPVHPGDRLEALTPGGPRIVVVVALRDKRGPAAVARALYEDHTPPPAERAPEAALGVRERGAG